MTTAARPTFNPAVGGGQRNEGSLAYHSQQYSAQDLPGHKKIKHRQLGQGTLEEVHTRDFRQELEEREQKHRSSKRGAPDNDTSYGLFPAITDSSVKKSRPNIVSSTNLDADEPLEDSDRDSTDDEEDDTAELMAELNRIRKEREAEQAKKDEARKLDDERIRMENLLHGNPLLSKKPGDFTVKRRWDDDVVFKNCAKGQDMKNKPKNFINDSLRSEFHKKFMDKYIK